MKIYNKSRKIIGIAGEPLLPGESMELPDGYEKHPSVADYIKKGMVVDAEEPGAFAASGPIDENERARIAEEAVARYKAEQEEKARAGQEAEISALKALKKPELLTKAVGMGLEVADDDTVDMLREKITEAIRQGKD